MKNFYQWMKEKYTYNQLRAISTYGCETSAPNGLSYNETSKLYDEHKEELHDVLLDWVEDVGESPSYILENLGNAYTFANAMVWFVAEIYANELHETMECPEEEEA